jgi:hypothetical protein
MRIKSLCTLLILIVLLPGLLLSLSGCDGGSSDSSSVQDSVAADNADPVIDEPDAVEEPISAVSVPPISEESVPVVEPVIETPVEQAILTWARDAGGLNHCDRLSIYEDGRVEAVVCRATTIEPTIHSTLSDEQITQVRSWVAAYAPFTRREMEMTRAVRTTVLQGTGATVPEVEAKAEVTSFAAEIFFALTGTE